MTLVVSPLMAHSEEEEENLICEETSESWIINDDDDDNNEILHKDINFDSIPMTMMMGFDDDDDDDSFIISLIKKEKDFKPGNDYLNRLRSKDSEFLLRNEAINWIWKACAHLNFGPLCLYLSLNYLDRFLTFSELPKDKAWAVQLLAVSCLSIAAKMEETYVPQSIDLQVEDPKFVFEAKTIKRMELLVLNTLNWRMQVVTPFSFVDYFARKIKDHHLFSEDFVYRSSSQLILNTTKEVEFLEFTPSEIAAAVVIAVSFSREVDEKVFSSLLHVKQERVARCLKMMRDLSDEISPGGATKRVPESPNGVLEAMCLSYKSDGSCTNSSNNSPNNNSNKRRKQQ